MAGNGGGAARGRGSTPSSRRPSASRGPSPVVYRRRRIAVLVLAVLVLMLLAGLGYWVAGLFGGAGQAAAEPDGGAGQAAAPVSPSTSARPAGPDCEQSKVVLRASTDQPAYDSGSNPLLIMEVANEGDFPCELNVGTNAMEF